MKLLLSTLSLVLLTTSQVTAASDLNLNLAKPGPAPIAKGSVGGYFVPRDNGHISAGGMYIDKSGNSTSAFVEAHKYGHGVGISHNRNSGHGGAFSINKGYRINHSLNFSVKIPF